MSHALFTCTALILLPAFTSGRHLMFLLNGVQCVYEDIEVNTKTSVYVALISDSEANRLSHVDIQAPDGNVIKSYRDIQYEHIEFTANKSGVYQLCIANIRPWGGGYPEKVFLNWILGEYDYEDQWFVVNNHGKALTMLETKTSSIHKNLRLVENLQLRDRQVFARGLQQAGRLNKRIMWWSGGQAIIVFSAGILQVFLLRQFFSVAKESI